MRNRRGAALLLVALLGIALLTMLAVVVDMSRMYTQKNELQTAADAGALAGMVSQIGDTTLTVSAAVGYGSQNSVLQSNISVAPSDVICGKWDDVSHTYLGDSDHCGGTDNAVTVTVRDSARFLFPGLLGMSKQLAVTARAFGAYVGATSCVKPWAIPYVQLTTTLQPDNPDIYRDLDALDIELLKTMSKADRTFTLKIGAPPNSGNFGSLDIPDSNPDAPNGGAALYEYNITNCNSTFIAIGDIIDTETGGMNGPTDKGVEDFCNQNGTFVKATGNCLDRNGNLGIPVKSVLWSQLTDKGKGKFAVTVRQIVSFVLENLSKKEEITGYFLPLQSGGAITGNATTIQRPILVQ